MLKEEADVLGKAIHRYWQEGKSEKIKIRINGEADEPLDPAYFFRTFDEMPYLEQYALLRAKGKCLDVGAAAGCHSLVLQEWGMDVTALEYSELSSEVAQKRGVEKVVCTDLMKFEGAGFDTIFLLMNGWGLGITLEGTYKLMEKLKTLLNPGGQIIGDTSDLVYMHPENKGQQMPSFGEKYYGEIQFDLNWEHYHTSFPWLYPAPQVLEEIARQHSMDYELVTEGEHYDFLVAISRPQ